MESSQFFNFCVRRKWITENPAAGLAKKIETEDVEILGVKAAEELLRAALTSSHAASVVPYLCVSLFAGLRPSEAQQLKWEQVNFATGQIEVLKSTSKTKETRFVTLTSFLAEWLLPFRKTKGPITGPNFTKDWKAVRELAGYNKASNPWPVDVLRHTFGSYWLAIHQDRARLAEEMGNSIAVIKRFYKRAIPRQTAEAFWKLQPKQKYWLLGHSSRNAEWRSAKSADESALRKTTWKLSSPAIGVAAHGEAISSFKSSCKTLAP